MTLGNLMNNTTIQGNVRLSVWKDGDEVDVICIDDTEDLWNCTEQVHKLEAKGINYMFASLDGYLHIELNGDD